MNHKSYFRHLTKKNIKEIHRLWGDGTGNVKMLTRFRVLHTKTQDSKKRTQSLNHADFKGHEGEN